jgi:YfiH family protein
MKAGRMGPDEVRWLEPEWPYGQRLRALTTTRGGGVSIGGYTSFNLADHVGDDPEHVRANRQHLSHLLGDMPIQWLEQVHGTRVVEAGGAGVSEAGAPQADAVWTTEPGQVLAVLTADCLPVVLGDRAGTLAAVVHGGWRGLVDGILRATIAAMPRRPDYAWLGPAIGADVYEVGEEVIARVLAQGPGFEAAVTRGAVPGKGYLDLAGLAALQLATLGIDEVYRSGLSTWDTDRFYSHRKTTVHGGGHTGRMATLAWLAPRLRRRRPER